MNVSEVLNISFWKNTSDDESQLQRVEFPQWRLILSLFIMGYWLLSVLPTALLSSSILEAMKNNSLNKSLAIIHIYILTINVFIRICYATTITAYTPSMIRFCVCSTATSPVLFYLQIYSVCYQPFALVNLAVFQLLIIKGKKTLVNCKTVGASLIIITIVSIFIPLAFAVIRYNDGQNTFVCTGVCPGPTASNVELLLFVSYAAIVWIPSLLIVVMVTIWSCAIFKHNYAGRDSELNRRIISVPLIMPAIITLATVIPFALFRVADQIPTLSADAFIYNWAVSVNVVILLVNEILNGLSYPCLILFLAPKLFKSWKMLFKTKRCCFAPWIHNQVIPT